MGGVISNYCTSPCTETIRTTGPEGREPDEEPDDEESQKEEEKQPLAVIPYVSGVSA